MQSEIELPKNNLKTCLWLKFHSSEFTNPRGILLHHYPICKTSEAKIAGVEPSLNLTQREKDS